MKRTALIICFFLFALRVGAQTDGTDTPVCNNLQECVDIAQQSAADADAKKQVAMDFVNQANDTLQADAYNYNHNGVCEAQVQDDIKVLKAVNQDDSNAQNAAQAAGEYASNAQTYANNGDLASAQQAAANAAAQDAQAQNAATKAQTDNANVDDKVGDPDNTIWNNNDPTCTSTDNSTDDITNFNGSSPIPDPPLNQQYDPSIFPSTPTIVQGDSSGGGNAGGGGDEVGDGDGRSGHELEAADDD